MPTRCFLRGMVGVTAGTRVLDLSAMVSGESTGVPIDRPVARQAPTEVARGKKTSQRRIIMRAILDVMSASGNAVDGCIA